MLFRETPLPGCFIIELEPQTDERGFYGRSFCMREFELYGLNGDLAQCGVSFNRRKGTLRGMHFQAAPHAECKTVRCTRGAIYDVALDMRMESSTFGRWHAVEISADDRRMHYLPEGVAHGFLTLTDDTEVLYQMSAIYRPEAARAVRWNDPAFKIAWPSAPLVISARDRSVPLFADARRLEPTAA